MKGQNLEHKPTGDVGSHFRFLHLVFNLKNLNHHLCLSEVTRTCLPKNPKPSVDWQESQSEDCPYGTSARYSADIPAAQNKHYKPRERKRG